MTSTSDSWSTSIYTLDCYDYFSSTRIWNSILTVFFVFHLSLDGDIATDVVTKSYSLLSQSIMRPSSPSPGDLHSGYSGILRT